MIFRASSRSLPTCAIFVTTTPCAACSFPVLKRRAPAGSAGVELSVKHIPNRPGSLAAVDDERVQKLELAVPQGAILLHNDGDAVVVKAKVLRMGIQGILYPFVDSSTTSQE